MDKVYDSGNLFFLLFTPLWCADAFKQMTILETGLYVVSL